MIYALVDGLFQQCLLKHLSGDETAIVQMQDQLRDLLVSRVIS